MKKIISISTIACLLIVLANSGCQKELPSPGRQLPNINSNGAPVAKAGNDTTIILPANQVKLDGSGSFDPDNDIMSFQWIKISGPASGTIVTPDSAKTNVTNLVKGSYEFRLTVTDIKGAISQDVCFVIVDTILIAPPPPPGTFFWISMNPHDTVLNVPASAVTLTASTWSVTNQPMLPAIASIEWRKVAGPNNYVIQSPAALSTDISGLSDGLYAFQCKITDSSGWSNVSYGGVINVTDTTTPGQEIIIPNQTWYGTLGECNYVQFDLSSYIPANRSIKKVFVKQDCDTTFTQAHYYLNAPADYHYVYQFDFSNGKISLIVYECRTFSDCSGDPNNTPDIKITF